MASRNLLCRSSVPLQAPLARGVAVGSARSVAAAPRLVQLSRPTLSRHAVARSAAPVRLFSVASAARAPGEEGAFVKPPITEEDRARLLRQRNVGISAHIDSGKTTLTERVLFYTGRIKDIHEVRGKDNVGAKMDHMELEREKGITIQSAATYCSWRATPPWEQASVSGDTAAIGEGEGKEEYKINIIDTPGHVDFTIEVERALRVLDGAVLVLCAVSGVQSQTITVDRQMKRYNVPRISFINKMDRQGSNPWRVVDQIREKLKLNAAAVQIPIGQEEDFEGVVDLIRWKAVYNDGTKGIIVKESDEIPVDLLELAKEKRQVLIEALADVDDDMANLVIEEKDPSAQEMGEAIRRATIACKFTPVFMGSAIKNKGVQSMLDGVCNYLPNPQEVKAEATDISPAAMKEAADKASKGLDDENEIEAARKAAKAPVVELAPAATGPVVGLAFKLEEGRYGQLTYMRMYQGTLKRGNQIINIRTGKRVKVPRLVRMHSDDMEEVDEIGPGEICAMFGVECSSGDTFTDGKTSLTMTEMFVPEPVISLSITPESKDVGPNFSRALNRFQKEDPTFRVHVDRDSGETIISGMGELHLEIYVERMRREYGVGCTTGKPRVAFRETITQKAPFNFTHKKQTGGAGQFGRVMGYIEPCEVDKETGKVHDFESVVMGGHIPAQYIPACEKGFEDALEKGNLAGYPVQGVRMVLEDGLAHSVDSSELAFRIATIGAFREAYAKTLPVILEPRMTVEVTAPMEFQGAVIGSINQRKGIIADTDMREDEFTVVAEVSLNEMFGYSSTLRGLTQGKGEFSMEYCKHEPVMPNIQKEMEAEYQKQLAEKVAAKK